MTHIEHLLSALYKRMLSKESSYAASFVTGHGASVHKSLNLTSHRTTDVIVDHIFTFLINCIMGRDRLRCNSLILHEYKDAHIHTQTDTSQFTLTNRQKHQHPPIFSHHNGRGTLYRRDCIICKEQVASDLYNTFI